MDLKCIKLLGTSVWKTQFFIIFLIVASLNPHRIEGDIFASQPYQRPLAPKAWQCSFRKRAYFIIHPFHHLLGRGGPPQNRSWLHYLIAPVSSDLQWDHLLCAFNYFFFNHNKSLIYSISPKNIYITKITISITFLWPWLKQTLCKGITSKSHITSYFILFPILAFRSKIQIQSNK